VRQPSTGALLTLHPTTVVEMVPSNVIVANFAQYKGRYVRLSERELEVSVKVGDENTPFDEMDAAALRTLQNGFQQTDFDEELGLFVLIYPFPVTKKKEQTSCHTEEYPDGCYWITSGNRMNRSDPLRRGNRRFASPDFEN
jgi:hypothetical protein